MHELRNVDILINRTANQQDFMNNSNGVIFHQIYIIYLCIQEMFEFDGKILIRKSQTRIKWTNERANKRTHTHSYQIYESSCARSINTFEMKRARGFDNFPKTNLPFIMFISLYLYIFQQKEINSMVNLGISKCIKKVSNSILKAHHRSAFLYAVRCISTLMEKILLKFLIRSEMLLSFVNFF